MPPENHLKSQSPCPCGTSLTLANCCFPYISGKQPAPTAEALMRSRYTAHALLAIDYLWGTWSTEQRIQSSKEDIYAWAASCEWLKLEILSTQKGQINDSEGAVHFTAFYRSKGNLHQHDEKSLFKKSFNRWMYIGHLD